MTIDYGPLNEARAELSRLTEASEQLERTLRARDLGFDQRAALWLARTIPGAVPIIGTVEFGCEWAAYASGGWASIDVAWQEPHRCRFRFCSRQEPRATDECHAELTDNPNTYDLTRLIREICDIE